MGELERSLGAARILRKVGHIPVRRMVMDLNNDQRSGSSRLHAAAAGCVHAHTGYEPPTKPDMLVAAWAALILCNRTDLEHATPIHHWADRGYVTLQIDLRTTWTGFLTRAAHARLHPSIFFSLERRKEPGDQATTTQLHPRRAAHAAPSVLPDHHVQPVPGAVTGREGMVAGGFSSRRAGSCVFPRSGASAG